MFPITIGHTGQLTKYLPTDQEKEIDRLMSILELDLGEENLNLTGRKLFELQYANLDISSDSVQNVLLL